jgi:hypothetical protein
MNTVEFWMGISIGCILALIIILAIVWFAGNANAEKAKAAGDRNFIELQRRNDIGRMQCSALQVIGAAITNVQETAVEIRDALRTQNEMGTDVREILANAQTSAETPELPTGITMKVYRHTPDHEEYLSARFPKNQAHTVCFPFKGHNWRYEYTSFDDVGPYDVLWRPADDSGPALLTASQATVILGAAESLMGEIMKIHKAIDHSNPSKSIQNVEAIVNQVMETVEAGMKKREERLRADIGAVERSEA